MSKPLTTGIILAAGQGKRVSFLGKHKGMIELDGEFPIVWTLKRFSEIGLQKAILVIGYQADIMKSFLSKYSFNIDLQFVSNNEFESTDSSYSFLLASQLVDEPFILTSADTMTTNTLLKRVLYDLSPNVIAVDKNQLDDKMDMRVKIKANKVIEMSKDIPLFEANGESAELYKFDITAKNQFMAACNNKFSQGKKSFWFETILSELLPTLNLTPVYCEPNDWCEIDTVEDINRARQFVQYNNGLYCI